MNEIILFVGRERTAMNAVFSIGMRGMISTSSWHAMSSSSGGVTDARSAGGRDMADAKQGLSYRTATRTRISLPPHFSKFFVMADPRLVDSKATFASFSHILDTRILRALADMGFARPTLVQAKAIPLALESRDILARARTGSGKTAAYCVPVVQKILSAKSVGGSAAESLKGAQIVLDGFSLRMQRRRRVL
jgi:hypothetical protein